MTVIIATHVSAPSFKCKGEPGTSIKTSPIVGNLHPYLRAVYSFDSIVKILTGQP